MSNTLVGRKVRVEADPIEMKYYNGRVGIIASIGDSRLEMPITVAFPEGDCMLHSADELKYLNNRPVVLP